ncbi:hypothetical protein HWV62_20354 [Athelia sp. TMB]|nr:hypothetical protein HWV62_20354 [Athelia sp. TMB]
MTSIIASTAASAAKAAHSSVATLLATAQVKPGAKIPATTVKEDDPHEGFPLSLTGKNILIGVPGAFTPPCSSQVPGYISNYEKFKERGVKDIYVVAVNDAFVTKAWKQKLAPDGTPVRFIADDTGAFTGALGLLFDANALLGAPRAKRYVIVTEGDTVEHIALEEDPTQVTVTSADAVLVLL